MQTAVADAFLSGLLGWVDNATVLPKPSKCDLRKTQYLPLLESDLPFPLY